MTTITTTLLHARLVVHERSHCMQNATLPGRCARVVLDLMCHIFLEGHHIQNASEVFEIKQSHFHSRKQLDVSCYIPEQRT